MDPPNASTVRTIKSVLSALGGAALLAAAQGCARPYGVPPFTQLVAEAPGHSAAFAAPDSGTVWVAGPGQPPFEARHIVYSGPVHRGETIAVDPAQRRLVVDGQVAEATIDKGFYQIWFQPVRHDLLAD